jgi:hypothetical protein
MLLFSFWRFSMARPYLEPDPMDRSVNEPTLIVSAAQVLGLYNQENQDDKKERVVDSVKEWYKKAMITAGWRDVVFHGNQCVLTANIRLWTGK